MQRRENRAGDQGVSKGFASGRGQPDDGKGLLASNGQPTGRVQPMPCIQCRIRTGHMANTLPHPLRDKGIACGCQAAPLPRSAQPRPAVAQRMGGSSMRPRRTSTPGSALTASTPSVTDSTSRCAHCPGWLVRLHRLADLVPGSTRSEVVGKGGEAEAKGAPVGQAAAGWGAGRVEQRVGQTNQARGAWFACAAACACLHVVCAAWCAPLPGPHARGVGRLYGGCVRATPCEWARAQHVPSMCMLCMHPRLPPLVKPACLPGVWSPVGG